MMSDSTWADGLSRPGVDSQAREDALDALRNVLGLRLTGGCWKVVEQAVDTLNAALVAGDNVTFWEAVCDLEQVSPTRATRLGEEPTVPAPKPVRERIDELIRSLDGSSTADHRIVDDNADSRE